MFSLTPITRTQFAKKGNDYNDVYRIMDNFFNDDFFKPNYIERSSLQNIRFGIDIQENEKEYVLEVDVPGVKREEIVVDFKDNQLIINVDCKNEKEDNHERYIRKERQRTSLKRSFLMDDVQGDAISAKLEDGVLTIIAPKIERVENSYKIEVQ